MTARVLYQRGLGGREGGRQRGNTPFPKLTKEARPAGNPTITPGFHCVDRARPLVGVMGVMGVKAPRDLQCKDGTMTALLGCSGALLPPSFGRAADLGFERGGWGGGRETRRRERTRQARASSFRCKLSVCSLAPSLYRYSSGKIQRIKVYGEGSFEKGGKASIRGGVNKLWRWV